MQIGPAIALTYSIVALGGCADFFPQRIWCKDPLTSCRPGNPEWFPGARLTIDTPLGVVHAPGTKISLAQTATIRGNLVGTVGVYQAIASVQFGVLSGGGVTYPTDTKYLLRQPGGTATAVIGAMAGACVLGDALCGGIGLAGLDGSAFDTSNSLVSTPFWYFALQPGSIARYFAAR